MSTNPTGQGKARISLVVDEVTKERIALAASANRMSLNAYIEGAIDEALNNGLQFKKRTAFYPDALTPSADPEARAQVLKDIAAQQRIADAEKVQHDQA